MKQSSMTLQQELENHETTHRRRLQIGEGLEKMGDSRPGVGVKDGMPDIAWLPVTTGGEVKITRTNSMHVQHFNEAVMQKPFFAKGVGGYNIYRIPALLTTQKGTLLAFCEAREAGDSSNIDLLLRRSEDGGETWSRKQVVCDQGKNVCGNPCPVQDRETGIIWLLMT